MKRNISFVLRLSKDEIQRLDKNVKKTGMSREGYIRSLIAGYEPQALPPVEYYDVLRELRNIEEIMRGLADRVPVSNMESMAMFTVNARRLSAICDRLQDAFLPHKKD